MLGCVGSWRSIFQGFLGGLDGCATVLLQEQVRRLEERLAASQQRTPEGMQQPADAGGGGMGAARPGPVMHAQEGITA